MLHAKFANIENKEREEVYNHFNFCGLNVISLRSLRETKRKPPKD